MKLRTVTMLVLGGLTAWTLQANAQTRDYYAPKGWPTEIWCHQQVAEFRQSSRYLFMFSSIPSVDNDTRGAITYVGISGLQISFYRDGTIQGGADHVEKTSCDGKTIDRLRKRGDAIGKIS